MRFFALWLSVAPLFNEGALSRVTEHPVIVRSVVNPVHPYKAPKSQPKKVDASSPRRLLQHERKVNASSVKVTASKTIVTFGAPKKVSALSPEQEEAYMKGYTLQFAGLASNGVEPKDTMDYRANRCMVSGNVSETGGGSGGGGIGLTWGPCPHFVQKDKFGVPTGDAKKPTTEQLFQFTIDGKVRHVQTGKCIRRVKCGIDPGPFGPERPYVYDLGFCDEKGVIRVQIWEARANLAAITLPMGNALNAVEGTCIACGPFMMQQVCKGPCDMVEVTTGWTKQPSAYNVKKEKKDVGYLRFGPFQDGLCNSFVKDEDALASWWYFHKYDIPK